MHADSLTIGAIVEDENIEEFEDHDRDVTLTFRTETDFELKYSRTLTQGILPETELSPQKSMDIRQTRERQVIALSGNV